MCITKGAGCRRLPAQQIITCKVDICLQPDVRNRFICTRDGSISYYGRQGSRRPEWRTISLKPKLHSRPCLSPPRHPASWSTVLYNMPIAYNKRTFCRKRFHKMLIFDEINMYILQVGLIERLRERQMRLSYFVFIRISIQFQDSSGFMIGFRFCLRLGLRLRNRETIQ